MTDLPTLPRLDPAEMHLGASPSLVTAELRATIEDTIRAHPRSLQRKIGPSELGTPCTRKLAYKLTDTEPVVSHTAWRPVIGTAVHSWLAEAFVQVKLPDGRPRYLVETRVHCGDIRGVALTGTCDLYDRVTGSVIDWKIVGPSSLRAAKAGVRDAYRLQVQLYALGFTRRGLPVENVGIAYLPSTGELHDMHVAWFPYDPRDAEKAIETADGLMFAIETLGRETMFAALPTADDYCATCPFLDTRSTDPTRACPGHSTVIAAQRIQEKEQ